MDIKKTYGTDSKKEIEGVWHEFGDGLKCKIARANNPAYQKEFARLIKPHRKAMRRQTLSDEIAERIMVEALAKTILLEWEGLTEDGVDVPYSEKEAVRILTTYKDFRVDVSEVSEDLNQFKINEDQDAEKN